VEGGMLFPLELPQLSFLQGIHKSGACAIQWASVNDKAFKHYFNMVRMYESGLV